MCLALVVDENGQKMSKSRGNVIEPWEIFNNEGADALRWYFFSSGQPWTTRRVYPRGHPRGDAPDPAHAVERLLVLRHLRRPRRAGLRDVSDATEQPQRHVLDRWVLSELDDTVDVVTDALEGFDALDGATRLAAFIDDLSNWYVRRSRPRFWKSSDPRRPRHAARGLVTVAQLLAPFCPSSPTSIYTTLTGESSVHTSDWPAPAGATTPRWPTQMAAARRLVAIGRAARTDAKVKVRQPLGRALMLHPGDELAGRAASTRSAPS